MNKRNTMHFFHFSKKDAMIFADLLKAIEHHESEVSVPKGVSDHDLLTLYKYAVGITSNIEVNPCCIQTISDGRQKKIQFTPLFSGKREKEQIEFSETVDEIVQEISLHVSSEYMRIKAAYLYLVNNVVYENIDKRYENHSAWAAIVENRAVCEGIAHAFSVLVNRMSIPCAVVYGMASQGNGEDGPHAWNMVCLNQNYYHVDVTWGLPAFFGKTSGAFNYFMLCDDEIAVDHVWDAYFLPQCCSYEFDYFIQNEAYALNENYCKKIIRKQLQEGEIIYLKLNKKDIKMCNAEYLLETIRGIVQEEKLNISNLTYQYNDRLHIFHAVCQKM